MNAALIIIGLLLAFVTGFFTAIKSVQIGLKWQMQTKEGKEPELKSPIQPIVEAVQQRQVDKVNQYSQDTLKEWINGQ